MNPTPTRWQSDSKNRIITGDSVREKWQASAHPIPPSEIDMGRLPLVRKLPSSDGGTKGALRVVEGTNDSTANPNYTTTISSESITQYEEFVYEIDAVRHKYEAAMKEMAVRFDVLDRELELKAHRNPINHVETRVKSPRSIFEKLLRYGKVPTIENVEKYLMDVAGVRVVVSYEFDVYTLLDLLKRQDDLEVMEIKDYIKNPKPNGYRSLHAIMRIPVYFMDSKQMVPVEIQFRTLAMDFWASLEHELKYKSLGNSEEAAKSYAELKDCSDIIRGVEERLQAIARKIEV